MNTRFTPYDPDQAKTITTSGQVNLLSLLRGVDKINKRFKELTTKAWIEGGSEVQRGSKTVKEHFGVE